MFCSKCGTEALANAKFCSNCGGAVFQAAPLLSVPLATTPPSVSTSGGFFVKLSRGDYGLAKTYWLYGAAVAVVFALILNAIGSPGFVALGLLVHTFYGVINLMGTWNAASKYTGPKIWASLAKVASVLSALMMAFTLFSAIPQLLRSAF